MEFNKFHSLKENLMGLFRTKQENPEELSNMTILDQVEELTTQLEAERNNSSANTIEITTAALDVANIIIPYAAITNIVSTGKMLSKFNKPLENNSKLNLSPKIFKIAGHAGQVASEFTLLLAIGRLFSNAVLMTESLLGIGDKQRAA